MHWVIQFLVRHRNISSVALTTVLSLWMITSTQPQQQRIARMLTLTVFYPVHFTFHQVTRIRNTFAENRRLRSELTVLSTRLAMLEERVGENRRLRELLGFREDFAYDLLPVRIVAREPSHLFRSVVINAGKDHGLTSYMPLVNSRGVVGKVTTVLPHMSLVQLLKDPSNRVSVMFRKNRTVGILQTEDGEDFFIRCRPHTDVVSGDLIVTSGLGGVYPEGLHVGEVSGIEDGSDPLFKRARVEPAVDFEHLAEAFVIRMSPQWQGFLQELDSLELE